jgi:hypothetical protein
VIRRAATGTFLTLAVATGACESHPTAPADAHRPRASIDAGPRSATHDAVADAGDGATSVAPGPTGSIEGRVFLDGPIQRGQPIQVASAWSSNPGCRDAALRYAQAFDITQPGPFPGALVFADAHERSAPSPQERRVVFRDCDIVPRVLFAHIRDHIVFHPDTRVQILPHVVGAGAAIDRLLIPGQPDIEIHVPGPGIFPVTVRTLPDWVTSRLIVLGNRFIDTTDTGGNYRITDIPPGRVLVHAWYPGAIEAREVVEIRANETAHADFHVHQAPARPLAPRDAGPVPP